LSIIASGSGHSPVPLRSPQGEVCHARQARETNVRQGLQASIFNQISALNPATSHIRRDKSDDRLKKLFYKTT
jgi:hypothetical protein